MDYEGLSPVDVSFYWQQLGISDLIIAEDVPDTQYPMTPFYGSIYRTVEYDRPLRNSRAWSGCVSEIKGFKIAGMPSWIDGNSENLAGRFLCMMTSTDLSFHTEYPLLNVPKPITTMQEIGSYDFLDWGIGGNLYVFIDEPGNLDWVIQNY